MKNKEELFDELLAIILENYKKKEEIKNEEFTLNEDAYLCKLSELQKKINFYKKKLDELKKNNQSLGANVDKNLTKLIQDEILNYEREKTHLLQSAEKDYFKENIGRLKQLKIKSYNELLETIEKYQQCDKNINELLKCQSVGHDFSEWELHYEMVIVSENRFSKLDKDEITVICYDHQYGEYYCDVPKCWIAKCQRCGFEIKAKYSGKDNNELHQTLEEYKTKVKRNII